MFSAETISRDVEILKVLDPLGAALGDDYTDDDVAATLQEAAKRCDCPYDRVAEALANASADVNHPYWTL